MQSLVANLSGRFLMSLAGFDVKKIFRDKVPNLRDIFPPSKRFARIEKGNTGKHSSELNFHHTPWFITTWSGTVTLFSIASPQQRF